MHPLLYAQHIHTPISHLVHTLPHMFTSRDEARAEPFWCSLRFQVGDRRWVESWRYELELNSLKDLMHANGYAYSHDEIIHYISSRFRRAHDIQEGSHRFVMGAKPKRRKTSREGYVMIHSRRRSFYRRVARAVDHVPLLYTQSFLRPAER